MNYKYFTTEELHCKCGRCDATESKMNDDFMCLMDILREKVGFPLTVSSAFRCKQYNSHISTTGLNGPHTTGRAIDLLVDRENAYIVLKKALELGFTGAGIKQKGISRFIHLDNLTKIDGFPRPTIWSY